MYCMHEYAFKQACYTVVLKAKLQKIMYVQNCMSTTIFFLAPKIRQWTMLKKVLSYYAIVRS